jgi:flagella basal body P-ring formation protein FlgA
MILRIIAAILLIILASPATAEIAAKLKREVVVTGELVRIGDLVENAGPIANIPIFRSPDLGQTGTVPAARVLDAVMLHGLIEVDARGILEVAVTRASRSIAAPEIEARIACALTARYSLGDPKNLAITFDRELRSLNLEPTVSGEPQVARIYFDRRSGRFDLTFEIADSTSGRVMLRYTGIAVETFEAVIPSRPLARGEVLKASEVTIERRPKAEFSADIVRTLQAAVGLAARRPLQPGLPLRNADLMKPQLVSRDESVTLVYEAPGIVLSMRGKALDAGAEGDVVSVLNVQSKRTVQGTVIGPGRVMVQKASPVVASTQPIITGSVPKPATSP